MPFVASYALRLITTCLAWRSCVGDWRSAGLLVDQHGGNGSPVVAVWALPTNKTIPACGGDCEYVQASYIKWLESAGLRTIPVRYDATPEELKPLMDGVNGLFLPGGGPPIPEGVRWAIEYATTLNDKGDFFPIWGTCLGWEWIAQAVAGNDGVLTVDYDAQNLTQPLGVLPGVEADSRLLSAFPAELLEKVSTEPLTANAHRKGVSPEAFAHSGLDQTFRLLAVNADRKGSEYVSAVEAFDYPVYGLQWHPEKNPYEWRLDPDGTPHEVVKHTADAIQLAQVLVNFFASETRRSKHSFPSIMDWEPSMFHNREVTPTGLWKGPVYFLHNQARARKRPRMPSQDRLGSGVAERGGVEAAAVRRF